MFVSVLYENAESFYSMKQKHFIFPVWEVVGKPFKLPINQSYILDFILLGLLVTLMDTIYFYNPFHRPSDFHQDSF